MRALTNLGILRQAPLDKSNLLVFAKALAEEPEDDVLAALKQLGATPPEEHRAAFPNLGTILDAVADAKRLRLQSAELDRNRYLVAWRCPRCGWGMTGFLRPGDDTFRTCGRSVGLDPAGNRLSCNYELAVIVDERSQA